MAENNYDPPENDNITQAFDTADLIPDHLKGSDKFLDIVTWNIRYFHHHDENRVERISQVLSLLNSDIIVLQEILDESLAPVAANLRDQGAGHYEVAYGTTGGNQRVAIMWDLDWIRAKDDINELVRKKQVISSDGKDAFPRAPLWGYFTGISNDPNSVPFDFQLVGVHLKSQRGGGMLQRQKAGDFLAEWLMRDAQLVDVDTIVIGDWNEPPSAEAWTSLKELEAENELLFESINNESHISHLYYKNKKNIGSRLDLAMVSVSAWQQMEGGADVVTWLTLEEFLDNNPEKKKAQEIKDFLKGIRDELSDHLPVVTRFYFDDKGYFS